MKALVQTILNATAAGKSMLLAANATAQKALLSLVKGDVGLGNVDNTADTAKPVSTAQQTALDLKANLASPTFSGTVNAEIIAATGTIRSTPTAVPASGMVFGVVENGVEKFGYRSGAGSSGELAVIAHAPHSQIILLRPRSSVSGNSLIMSSGIYFRNTIDTADALISAGAITASGLMTCGVYTFATVPSASSNTGKFLRISDRAQKHAYSDGTNWRFFGDDAIIS